MLLEDKIPRSKATDGSSRLRQPGLHALHRLPQLTAGTRHCLGKAQTAKATINL